MRAFVGEPRSARAHPLGAGGGLPPPGRRLRRGGPAAGRPFHSAAPDQLPGQYRGAEGTRLTHVLATSAVGSVNRAWRRAILRAQRLSTLRTRPFTFSRGRRPRHPHHMSRAYCSGLREVLLDVARGQGGARKPAMLVLRTLRNSCGGKGPRRRRRRRHDHDGALLCQAGLCFTLALVTN